MSFTLHANQNDSFHKVVLHFRFVICIYKIIITVVSGLILAVSEKLILAVSESQYRHMKAVIFPATSTPANRIMRELHSGLVK